MTFDLKRWLSFVQFLAPIVLAFTGVPISIVTAVANGITAAEQITGADGPTKKASVVAIAKSALDVLPVLTVDQKANALAAVDEGIDTTVALVNAIHKAPATPVPPVL